MLNALTGGNATPATNELGLQVRRLCPLKGVKSWKKIDQSIKDAVVQAVLDKFEIVKIFILMNKLKRSLIQRRISCTRIGGVCLDDWKHMIDVAWKDESHLKRSKASKANRSLLPYNHTSGSRSFPIAMSIMDAMVNLQASTTDSGMPLTYETLSRQVLRQRKNYLRGFRIGPRPYSLSDSVTRSRDKQMEAMRSEMEVFRKERQRDHEDLMKEKEEHQRYCEETMKEKEELMKEVEEGKKTREAQQEQLNHLNDVVL
ncbi:hypothetical protein ACSBR1_013955 [Camellia fascicularis]